MFMFSERRYVCVLILLRLKNPFVEKFLASFPDSALKKGSKKKTIFSKSHGCMVFFTQIAEADIQKSFSFKH